MFQWVKNSAPDETKAPVLFKSRPKTQTKPKAAKPKAKAKAKPRTPAKKGKSHKQSLADGSSGEEEQKAKAKTRRKPLKRGQAAVAIGDLPPGLLLVDADGLPEIKDLSQLLKDFPHMSGDMSTPDRCVNAALFDATLEAAAASLRPALSGKDEKGKDDLRMSETEDPQSDPMEIVELFQRLSILPKVRPVVGDGEKWQESDKVSLLKTKRLFLPLMTASFESELLQAAGRWKYKNGRMYDFPPCPRGDECVGKISRIPYVKTLAPGGPNDEAYFDHPFVCFMLPTDYANFIKDGAPPTQRFPCVACMRCMIVDVVCALRGGQEIVQDGKRKPRLTLDENTLVQCYRNLINEKDGYHFDCCLEPSSEEWHGIVSPIATFRPSLMVARKGRFNRPYVDQSAIVWKPAVIDEPMLGESIKDFSAGVSS